MRFAYELNPRQSARVLEQALRSGVTIRLDPHYSSGLEGFAVQLVEDENDYLTFRILEGQQDTTRGLCPGMYCQAQFSLAGVVYLLSTYVIDVNEQAGWLRTARPEMLQIIERRKFIRANIAAPAPVLIRWLNREKHAIADLLNVGGEGMAFKIAEDLAAELLIDDPVEVEFNLAGLKRHFRFRAVVCNKTPVSNSKVVVGVQFQAVPEDHEASEALAELRRFLVAHQKASATR